MKQLLQSTRTGAIEIAEVPAPTCRPGGVLVRTQASALSVGTERTLAEFARKSLVNKAVSRPDLVRQVMQKARRDGWLSTWQAVQTRLDSSIPVGYSSAGVVVEVGDAESPFRVGDRVVCGGGGYATHSEMAFVPYNLTARLMEGVAADEAAFGTIGAVGLHGLRLADVQIGGTIAVIGLGIIGQLVVQMGRAAGLRVAAIDPDASRVDLALQHGAEIGVVLSKDDPSAAIAGMTGASGVDAAILTAASESSEPLELAVQMCRDRARVVAVGAVGLNVPRKGFFEKELQLVVSRSYGPGRYDPVYEEHGVDYPIGYVRWTEQRNLEAFADLLHRQSISLRNLITHRFPITEAERAYDLILGKNGAPFLGVALTYPERETSAQKSITLEPQARGGARTRVGVGVIGAGNFARQILFPRLKAVKSVDLVAVASAGGVTALDAARQFGFRRATTGYDDLISDPDIDCLIIETRHHLHAEIAIAALDAGKAIYVEKPLALTLADLERVCRAWVSAGKPPATVGFNRRLAPMVCRVRDFQGSGRGPWLVSIRVNAGTVPASSWVVDPAVGGGRYLGEGCHFIDLAHHFVAAEPVEVTASGPNPEDAVSQGDSATLVRFADGSVASIVYATQGSRVYGKERVEVIGGGTLTTIDDFRRLELVDERKRRLERDRLGQNKGHSAYLESFLASIASGSSFQVDFKDLVVSSLTTLRGVDSLMSGQTQRVGAVEFLRSVGID